MRPREAKEQNVNNFQTSEHSHRALLRNIARRAMFEHDLLPDFPSGELAELGRIQVPAAAAADDKSIHDLRGLLWASIDNDDSLDLDQLTVAEQLPGDAAKILVAVADVDSLVHAGMAIDEYALHNTASVYTAAEIFPMLPEKLSTKLTSLNADEDRLAVVIEMTIGANGTLQASAIYRALVRNHAKLAYNSVAAWLEGGKAAPEAVSALPALGENLRLQDRTAQKMRNFRHIHGALSLETIEARPIFDRDQISGLEEEKRNRAKDIIEDFMISANGVTARFLESKRFASIRRVVRVPKRWDKIVDLAKEHGTRLPEIPSSKALDEFLVREKAADPIRFPDLSLSVIKLLGQGEYIAEMPGGTALGHFGLAVKDYAHSTAPNRRYADLVTQRQLKAAIEGSAAPYDYDGLNAMALHLTQQEDAINKVERQVAKSAAALLLEKRIGEQFDAIVTGASEKGTWVRLLSVPVEGKLAGDSRDLDVGDRVRVQLISLNVERGFIDFRKV